MVDPLLQTMGVGDFSKSRMLFKTEWFREKKPKQVIELIQFQKKIRRWELVWALHFLPKTNGSRLWKLLFDLQCFRKNIECESKLSRITVVNEHHTITSTRQLHCQPFNLLYVSLWRCLFTCGSLTPLSFSMAPNKLSLLSSALKSLFP